MIRPYTTTTIVVVGCCLLAPLFVSCTTFALSTNKHINLRGSEYGSRRIFQIQLSLDLLSISGLTGSVIAWYILSNFFLRRVGFDPCAFPRSKNILNLGRSNQCPSGSGYTESSTPSVSVDLRHAWQNLSIVIIIANSRCVSALSNFIRKVMVYNGPSSLSCEKGAPPRQLSFLFLLFFLRRDAFDPLLRFPPTSISTSGGLSMDPDESGYDDSSTPSVSVNLLVSLLGRFLVTSSSLPIVGVYQHFPSLSEKFCLQEVMVYQHHHYLM